MNNSGMIRQIITFLFVLLVAVLIVSDIQWDDQTQRSVLVSIEPTDQTDRSGSGRTDDQLGFTDFRSGGMVRKRPAKVFDSIRSEPFESATSTRFSVATSTPFQSRSDGSSSVVFSSIRRSSPATTSAKAVKPAVVERAVVEREVVEAKAGTAISNKNTNQYEAIISDLAISGRIVDERGNVIKDLPLTLQLTQGSTTQEAQQAQAKLRKQTLNTRSDEDGVYSFVNLVEGSYRICTVETRGYKAVCQNPRAPHSSADFSMRGTLNGKIYGTVVDADGAPLKDVSISATPGQKNRALTDDKGHFEMAMTVSEALSYQIYFSKKEYQRERVTEKGAAILESRELNPVLKKTQLVGFDVVGAIYDQSGASVSGQTVTLYSPSVKSTLALRASSGPTGEFTIKHVAAAKDYRLSVAARGGYTFDSAEYQNIEIFEGMPPIQVQLSSGGKGAFSARVIQQNGTPLVGEVFTLYAGSAYAGRATSDTSGEIKFEDVPVKEGGSKLRVSSTASPRYSFSGMSLGLSEYQSGVELMVDRGENSLLVTVVDEDDEPIQGARAVLTWTHNQDGILSQTSRSRGKTSIAGSGEIRFSELGLGEHRLQVSLSTYKTYSQPIKVEQSRQQLKVTLLKN